MTYNIAVFRHPHFSAPETVSLMNNVIDEELFEQFF